MPFYLFLRGPFKAEHLIISRVLFRQCFTQHMAFAAYCRPQKTQGYMERVWVKSLLVVVDYLVVGVVVLLAAVVAALPLGLAGRRPGRRGCW